MKLLLLFSGLVLSVSLAAQYPSNGIKSRLGWQTTGDGLIYRGSGSPAYSPGTMFNAWTYLDTTNMIFYAYKNFQWVRVPNANNGLSFSGQYIQLGGTLVKNTTIKGYGYNFAVTDTITGGILGYKYGAPIFGDTTAYFYRAFADVTGYNEAFIGQGRGINYIFNRDTTQQDNLFWQSTPTDLTIKAERGAIGTDTTFTLIEMSKDAFVVSNTGSNDDNNSSIALQNGGASLNAGYAGLDVKVQAISTPSDTGEIVIKTDRVARGLADIGQVLTLQDTIRGLVEFSTIDLSGYLETSDTAAMLAPYIERGDTASMLLNYPSTTGWGITDAGKTWRADTSRLSTRYYVGANFFPLIGGTLTGTGGSGFVGLPHQSTLPSAPASGVRIYGNGTSFGWTSTDGFERQFASNLTGGRTYTLPDVSGTFALGTGANTRIPIWTGTNTIGSDANLYYSSGTFTNTTSLTGAVPLFSIFGDPGTGAGNVIQFLARNTNATSNKTEFKLGGTTTARQWSFGTDINGSGENSFYIYTNNGNKTTFYSTDSGNTAIGYSGLPNTTHARYTLDVWGTDGINFPRGTTAQRPSVAGSTNPMRWNTSDTGFEWYDGSKWNNIVASSFIAGTNKNVPYFNSSSQLAQSTSLQYDVAVGLFTVSLNRSGGTFYTAVNTQAANSAYSGYNAQTSGGQGRIIKLSATYSSYKNQRSSDFTIYNDPTGGNVSIMNDNTSGTFNVAVGGSSTAQMTLTSGGNFLLGTTTDVSRRLHVSGEARITDLTTDTPTRIVGADSDGDLGDITWLNPASNSLGIGISPTQQLDVNGDVRVRDSIDLEVTPAHTSITGLLTRDANGWVGAASLAGGLSYSGGVLTGANWYTADGTISELRTASLGSNGDYFRVNGTSNSKMVRTDMNSSDFNVYTSNEIMRLSYTPGTGYDINNRVTYDNYSGTRLRASNNYNFSAQFGTSKYGEYVKDVRYSDNNNNAQILGEYIRIDSISSTAARGVSAQMMRSQTGTASPVRHWAGLGYGGVVDRGNGQRFVNYAPNWVVQSQWHNSNTYYNWIRVTNLDTDTTSNRISFYNGKYAIPNATPGTGNNLIRWDNGTPAFVEQKRDTTIYVTDADYNFGTAITNAQVLARYNRIIIYSKLTASATSDNQIILPSAASDFLQCTISVYSNDASGDADVTSIDFTTNGAVDGAGGTVSSYSMTGGQKVEIRPVNDGGFKWIFN